MLSCINSINDIDVIIITAQEMNNCLLFGLQMKEHIPYIINRQPHCLLFLIQIIKYIWMAKRE